MSANIDKAKRLYDRFNAHDIPGILELLSPDIDWTSYGPDFALAVGHYHGRDGVQQFFKDLMTQQEDHSFVPDDYWDGGGTVHVIGVEEGTLADNGLPFVNHFDHTLWFSESTGFITRSGQLQPVDEGESVTGADTGRDPGHQAWLDGFLQHHGGVAGTVHHVVGRDLVLTAAVNIPPRLESVVARVAHGKGMAGAAQVAGETVQTCNLQEPGSAPINPAAREAGGAAAAAIPVVAGGEVVAVVGVTFPWEGEIDGPLLATLELDAARLPPAVTRSSGVATEP